jgi:hypothetical protein
MHADATIHLRYPSALEARRDRLPDVPRGVIARTRSGVREDEVLPVRIQLQRENVTIEARARVRWATPLATGTLVGLELQGPSRREEVQLDLLLGIRSTARPEVAADVALKQVAVPAMPRLSVAMLETGRVLREVLTSALARFARDGSGWDLQLEAAGTPDAFLEAMASRRRNLAVIDCDGIGDAAADALLDTIRSHAEWARIPVVLLSRSRAARVQDRHTVTMNKPVAMKALLHTTALLLKGGGQR